jgi:signal transduction histidine kinase/CheY-like chemotaxis protein
VPSPSNLRRRLPLWGLSLTLLILVGGALLGYLNARHLLTTEEFVGHSDDAIVDLTALVSAVRDAERSQRGYLLTDEQAQLQRYQDATGRIQLELAALRREVGTNAAQGARLATLRQGLTLKVAQLERMIALQRAGNRAAALAIIRAGTGKRLMDDIGSRVASMRRAEYATLARRADDAEFRARAIVIAIVAPTLIGAALLALMFYLGNRRIVELNDADRHKDEFLALLAHELRGPLAPLRNGLELIRRGDGAEELRHRACALMERQLEQLVRLVNDLLDASRIARGMIELRKQPMDLGMAIREVADGERPLAEAAGLTLTCSLPSQELLVDGDSVRLMQVFRNLLQNARKYTEPGGRIEVSVMPERGQAVARVKDTGLGIPPAKLEAIFEMFAQIEAGRRRSQGGLGIGLALARRLLALHGGSVHAFSEGPGRGSEFIVRLPLTLQACVRGTALARSEGAAPSRRVLVVDDNTDTASSLAALLRLAHHEAYTAHDGVAALSAAERLRPDVVLLDVQLPELDGYEVCRRLRQRPWGRHVTLVAVTGLGQPEDERRSREAGFDAYLVKPPDYAAIAQLLVPGNPSQARGAGPAGGATGSAPVAAS